MPHCLAFLIVSFVVLGCERPSFGAQSAPRQPPSDEEPATNPPAFAQRVEVIGATPLHGLGIDREKIPSNVQTLTADTLRRTGGGFVGEQLSRGVPSVQVNEATTNPFQPDLHVRGFVGSPLLGLPQGMAVYQNGVRVNEPFGDTVNWDLLPSNAIASIHLMPGSNPLFGLNALGGAVSVQTKSGFSHSGHSARLSAGSFGRYVVDAESGGHNDRLSYFVAGRLLSEEGWRDFSPSRVRQVFGDVEWRRHATTLNATVTAAVNTLVGNGPAPIGLLEQKRSAIFTYPDETDTNMALVTLRARHNLGPAVNLEGMLFYRRAAIETFNGDDSGYAECQAPSIDALLCRDEGEGPPVANQFGTVVAVDDTDELDGTNNTSERLSNGWGAALQATVVAPLAGRANHFVTGVTLDGGRTTFQSDTEIARLTAQRGTVGTGFLDRDAAVRLRTSVWHTGVYAADFLSVTPRLTLMGAARVNFSAVALRDRLGTALTGDHEFARLNPAAGFTYALPRGPTVYASVSLSSRVPAPSELSCADPDAPCRLPNAFVADPPLDQVVARTWEAGVRRRGGAVAWSASLFSTTTDDDIMFISSGPLTNTGHFANIGDTRRQGIELWASGAAGSLQWDVGYSWLRASFEAPITVSSPNHPHADNGEMAVTRGDRLPGVPGHNLRAMISAALERFTVGGSVVSASSQYLRGDEANLLPALDGYTTVNLTARYALARQLAVTAQVTNLFNREYATFGLLGEAEEVLGDGYEDPRFLSPGAPRAAWLGVELSFR